MYDVGTPEYDEKWKKITYDKKLNRLADDILRQVVCDCGNYRHHGVSWMPEGSGEGLSVAKELIKKFIKENPVSDWNETCSQAPQNKKENTMALHPGEAGHDEAFEKKCDIAAAKREEAGEDRRAGCTDMTPRNRRDDVRLSDIHRAVDKVVPMQGQGFVDKPCVITSNQDPLGARRFLNLSQPDPELLTALAKSRSDSAQTTPVAAEFDKNTYGSLRLLRWEIYDLIERYEGDYGKTISHTLKQEVEDLFKKYTHS